MRVFLKTCNRVRDRESMAQPRPRGNRANDTRNDTVANRSKRRIRHTARKTHATYKVQLSEPHLTVLQHRSPHSQATAAFRSLFRHAVARVRFHFALLLFGAQLATAVSPVRITETTNDWRIVLSSSSTLSSSSGASVTTGDALPTMMSMGRKTKQDVGSSTVKMADIVSVLRHDSCMRMHIPDAQHALPICT